MIHIQEHERRRAFSIWLRTGRVPSVRNADGIEFKFNPWHDPENGRFTFAGTGRYYARGGGPAEARSQGSWKVEYVSDPARPPITSMEEADAWRAAELAKHGHKPEYRKAIEARYQFYKRQAEDALKRVQDADRASSAPAVLGGTRTPSVTPTPRVMPPPSLPRSTSASKTPSAGRRQNARSVTPSDLGLPSDIGGGGGDFGGGGASGSWESPAASARRTMGADSLPDALHPGTPRSRAEYSRQSIPEHWRKVERNGYLYEIDDENRTRRVSGLITLNTDQGRSKTAQLSAGGSDRRTTDQGGHYIARRFNGPTEAFNHFAQNGSFNRSDYAKLENQWERAKRQRKQVRVKIVPVFKGGSQRPSALNVWFWIDGHRESQQLPNESKGERDGE